jgi:carboxymethylenebutenolidase
VPGFSTQTIECAGGMPAYLALPHGEAPAPAVIILHERYGFVRHPRDVAERFATFGMVGLAINGFFKCDFQPALADGSKRYHFTDPDAVAYVAGAVETLTKTGRIDPSKVALLGVCQTGRHPIVVGAESTLLAAAICWYGAGADKEFETGPYYPKPLADVLARINCPFLGLFGEKDNHIPVANVRRIRDGLERSGKTYNIHVYKDAPHGFLNDTMRERYRHSQSEAAWRVQMAFLEKAFGGGFDSTRAEQLYAANLAVSGA